MKWLSEAWAKMGLWAKLALSFIVALGGYVFYLRHKAKGQENEAEKLVQKNILKNAEAKVKYLQGVKDRNKARLDQIPEESRKLEFELNTERMRVENAKAELENLNSEETLKKFKDLGY